MTKEDKKLLLKDLCARLPYGIKININGEEDILLELGVDTGWVNASYDIDDVKPYLRPRSSIAELITAKEWSGLGGIDLIDWYNANHIDYRGLIEKGLALEATKDMYKI